MAGLKAPRQHCMRAELHLHGSVQPVGHNSRFFVARAGPLATDVVVSRLDINGCFQLNEPEQRSDLSPAEEVTNQINALLPITPPLTVELVPTTLGVP